MFIGEMAFLLNDRRSATILSIGAGKLIRIPKVSFLNLIRKNPHPDNFATPGYRNTETGATSVQDTLKIGKERFSLLYPYMKISEGYPQSLVTINYSLENDGNMIDMSVFSSKGIEVVRPYSNFEIGSYGSLFVDIMSLSERRIVPGIYILYIRCRTGEDIIEKKIVCPFVP